MALTGTKTYVGFGFGAIQAGLFLYEAFCSGNFARLVIAEVMPAPVAAVRSNNGQFTVNIAHHNGIQCARIGPIDLENPAEESDRRRLMAAVAVADEIGTAIPSVAFYTAPGPESLHLILAEGLRQKAAQSGPPAVVYAAENHNYAAQLLQSHVMAQIPAAERDQVSRRVQFVNTVIGKMSGIVTDSRQIQAQGLTPVTPGESRAFLVEAFNRILISKIQPFPSADQPAFERGITVFEEKADLLPFEEAKLYGHNATHALAAYIGAFSGETYIAGLNRHPDIMDFLRAAFIQESGQALIRKYAGTDALFTPDGFSQYADDLLTRMVNPYLHDTVQRVGRDPQRKLAWNDRLIGPIRMAHTQGISARRYALGAAAALAALNPDSLSLQTSVAEYLLPLWPADAPPPAELQAVLALLNTARQHLHNWRESGFKNLR